MVPKMKEIGMEEWDYFPDGERGGKGNKRLTDVRRL